MRSLRRLHRIVAIVAAAYLINIAVTGTFLAWSSIGDGLRQSATMPRPTALPAADLPRLAEQAYLIAKRAAPAGAILDIRLMMGDGSPRAAMIYGDGNPGYLFVDPVNNTYIIGPSGEKVPGGAALDQHSFLKRLHRGDLIGIKDGRWMSIIAGFCLLFLLASGGFLYGNLAIRRRALFWK